jgi:hypothetical protein
MVKRAVAIGSLSAVLAAGCSIDDRVLTDDEAVSAGGSSSVGTAGTSGGYSAGTGGKSGGTGGAAGGHAGSVAMGGGGMGTGGSAVHDAGSAFDGFVPDPDSPLIDDLEDDDGSILHNSGRRGYWLVFNDGTVGGVQTPSSAVAFSPTGPGHDSLFAARSTGHGFSGWGAAIAIDFMNGNPVTLYDASKYKGVTFWAKLVTGTLTSIRVVLTDADTLPVSFGGRCTGTACNDHFGVKIPLTRDWEQHTLLFSDMKQGGWGMPQLPALVPSELQALQFSVDPNETFDLWIDDVAFVR